MDSIRQGDLFPEARNAASLQHINDRCQIRTQGGYRIVLVAGMPLAQYAVGDRMSEAHAMVSLIDQGWADQFVRLLKGKLRLRQVTRQKEDGHQTPILTSRRDLPAAQVAYRMFDRWREENFFKARREVAHVTV